VLRALAASNRDRSTAPRPITLRSLKESRHSFTVQIAWPRQLTGHAKICLWPLENDRNKLKKKVHRGLPYGLTISRMMCTYVTKDGIKWY